MMYNSTIIRKKKPCKSCGQPSYIFSKGRCKTCSVVEDSLERMEEASEVIVEKDGLSDLIAIADEIYSKWLRKSGANELGFSECFTCGKRDRWEALHCGHYVRRGALFLRYDPRNTRIQCPGCNVFKDGNMAEYTQRLEAEHPGITEYLKQEAFVVYKPEKDELYSIIKEYKRKLKQLK